MQPAAPRRRPTTILLCPTADCKPPARSPARLNRIGRKGPIRFLYPGFVVRSGAAHVITKGGVEDFVKERVEYRKSKNSKVWGRYHIGYCWSPNIAHQPLSPWIYAVDVSENAGEMWNCDLWAAPNGDCHILWCEKNLEERLRPKYFSGKKLTLALKHGIMRNGKCRLHTRSPY